MLCTLTRFLPGFASFAPLGRIHHVRDQDADEVEEKQRKREDAHRQRVRSRGDDGGDDENNQNCKAAVLPKKARSDNSKQRQEQYDDRQLKGPAKAKYDRHEEAGVFANLDQRAELAAEAEEEIERVGEDPSVSEIRTSQEQRNSGCHEGNHIALLVLVEPGRNKQPDLIQHIGRRNDATCHEADLQVHVEAIYRVLDDELCRQMVFRKRIGDGRLHQPEDFLMKAPCRKEANDKGDYRVRETPTQLLQVLKEAHSRKF